MATTITIKEEAIPIVKSGLAIEENILKIRFGSILARWKRS